MNREIKFREFVNGKFHYWGFVREGSFHGPATPSVIRGIHEQFTGLHDKNGKEIYEGDIILEGITRKVIVWGRGAFHVQVPNYKPNSNLPTRPLCFDMWSPEGIRFEVIGDIHRNPELL